MKHKLPTNFRLSSIFLQKIDWIKSACNLCQKVYLTQIVSSLQLSISCFRDQKIDNDICVKNNVNCTWRVPIVYLVLVKGGTMLYWEFFPLIFNTYHSFNDFLKYMYERTCVHGLIIIPYDVWDLIVYNY